MHAATVADGAWHQVHLVAGGVEVVCAVDGEEARASTSGMAPPPTDVVLGHPADGVVSGGEYERAGCACTTATTRRRARTRRASSSRRACCCRCGSLAANASGRARRDGSRGSSCSSGGSTAACALSASTASRPSRLRCRVPPAWVHVALAREPTTEGQRLVLFVDGHVASSAGTAAAAVEHLSDEVLVGARRRHGALEGAFVGRIEGVRSRWAARLRTSFCHHGGDGVEYALASWRWMRRRVAYASAAAAHTGLAARTRAACASDGAGRIFVFGGRGCRRRRAQRPVGVHAALRRPHVPRGSARGEVDGRWSLLAADARAGACPLGRTDAVLGHLATPNAPLVLVGGRSASALLDDLWVWDLDAGGWRLNEYGTAAGNAVPSTLLGARAHACAWATGALLYLYGGVQLDEAGARRRPTRRCSRWRSRRTPPRSCGTCRPRRTRLSAPRTPPSGPQVPLAACTRRRLCDDAAGQARSTTPACWPQAARRRTCTRTAARSRDGSALAALFANVARHVGRG